MTLVDTNLLVYAIFEDAHGTPSEGEGTVALCWPVLSSLVRLITSRRVFGPQAVTVRDGWGVVAAYLEEPAVRIVSAGARHAEIAADLARTPGLRSEDVPDVEIAALAIEHGLSLASHDHGFRRFSRLRVDDPLVGA